MTSFRGIQHRLLFNQLDNR